MHVHILNIESMKPIKKLGILGATAPSPPLPPYGATAVKPGAWSHEAWSLGAWSLNIVIDISELFIFKLSLKCKQFCGDCVIVAVGDVIYEV